MKLSLEFNNLSDCPIRKEFFLKTLRETMEKSGSDFLTGKNISMSLALVGKAEIKKLNRIYRKINSATDVLSFAEYKNKKELARAGDKEIFLGELVLCYNQIEEYAKKDEEDLKVALSETVSHGMLHLLGLRHGKTMFDIQAKVAKK